LRVAAGGVFSAAATGAWAVAPNLLFSVCLMLTGLVGSVMLMLVERLGHRRITAIPLGPALVPTVKSAVALGRLHGSLELAPDGTYAGSVSPVEGLVRLSLVFRSHDRDIVRRFRAKHRLAVTDHIPITAGFAALRGAAGLVLDGSPHVGQIRRLGTSTAELPFLADPDSKDGTWTIEWPYLLSNVDEAESPPIWITPFVFPESDERTLELELQWERPGKQDDRKDSGLQIDQIGLVRVSVPATWGSTASDSVWTTQLEGGRKILESNQIRLNAVDRTTGRKVLRIRFEQRIQSSEHISGQLEATFLGCLSGLAGIDTYTPRGYRRSASERRDVTTEVHVDYRLSLANVRYQDVRVVPARKIRADQQRKQVTHYPGVVPDHETVIALTNSLSEDGYYIKRVTENQPAVGGRANVINRYWDIAGRHYDGVFPIDFHIVLTGDATYVGEIDAHAGNAAVRLTVRGTYANTEVSEQIESRWDHLHGRIDTVLRRVTKAPLRTHLSRPDAATRAGRVAQLQTRRSEAADAVLARHITEAVFQDIVSEIDRELKDLDGED
jgi:hypothetical protein